MADLHNPKFSLIVPVYGVEAYIADCLDSIIGAEGFVEYCELIVIDDGSPDDSMAIVDERCAGLTNVTIIRQTNAGLGAARNVGLDRATGDYVWFIDSDDEICADAISVLAQCVQRLRPDIIAFEFATIGDTLGRPDYLAVYDQNVDPVRFMTSGRPPSPVQFYAFSRDLIEQEKLRFERGIYHEDALFSAIAMVRAVSLVRLRDTCYRYRLRPGSIMSLARPKKHLDDMLIIAEKLGAHAATDSITRAGRGALAREIGFALAAAWYYAIRTEPEDRRRIAPLSRLAALGRPWWRHFPLRALVNYSRLLGMVALRDGQGPLR
ncbi:glycosyltransferase family 2 protein [Brevundimonas sp.]|uniref:glycosyltransferase family 2 protein n=1 Tax=Brevundimonas sp. TaxID=1871086 RepID=UPI002CFC5B12|nr:glycosyltransferase [Brevundimonas sp.]HWQ88275.1 glycosyltransferase [Brevundimonas sp.]